MKKSYGHIPSLQGQMQLPKDFLEMFREATASPTPNDRSGLVIVCYLALLAFLATVCLIGAIVAIVALVA